MIETAKKLGEIERIEKRLEIVKKKINLIVVTPKTVAGADALLREHDELVSRRDAIRSEIFAAIDAQPATA